MPLTAHQLDAFLEKHVSTEDRPLVVSITDPDDKLLTRRYYLVEHASTDNPPNVPEGTLVLYLGAELSL